MSSDENNGDDFLSWFEACREVARWMGEYRYMEGHSTAYMEIIKHRYHVEGSYVWPAYDQEPVAFSRLLLSIPGTVKIRPDGVTITVHRGSITNKVQLSTTHRDRYKALVLAAKLVKDLGIEPNRLDEENGSEIAASDFNGNQILVGDTVQRARYPEDGTFEVLAIQKVLRGETIRFKSGGGHASKFKVMETHDG